MPGHGADCARNRPIVHASAAGWGETGAKREALPDVRGVVEPVLIEVLGLAAKAGRWGIVEEIVAELRKRWESRGVAEGGALTDAVAAQKGGRSRR